MLPLARATVQLELRSPGFVDDRPKGPLRVAHRRRHMKLAIDRVRAFSPDIGNAQRRRRVASGS